MNLILNCPECDADVLIHVVPEEIEILRAGCDHVDLRDLTFLEAAWSAAGEAALDRYEDAMERQYDIWRDAR